MLLTPTIFPERQIQKARVELLQYPGVSTAAAKPSAGKIGAPCGCKVRPQLLAPPYLPPQHPPRHSSGPLRRRRASARRLQIQARESRARPTLGAGTPVYWGRRRPPAGCRAGAAARRGARDLRRRRRLGKNRDGEAVLCLGLGLRCPKSGHIKKIKIILIDGQDLLRSWMEPHDVWGWFFLPLYKRVRRMRELCLG